MVEVVQVLTTRLYKRNGTDLRRPPAQSRDTVDEGMQVSMLMKSNLPDTGLCT